ncbi:MAG: rhodanese-like domain-containing protein [Leptospiraceae bacterium]|nr:rhodanese-like domain-containing protein [Leptospiraceae bacterium]
MGLTITIITLVVSTIFLVFRFSNRNVKLGGSSAAQQAHSKIQEGATIIDVRSSIEYAVSSFPGSINIPVADISDKLNSIPKDKPIVVYCASGGRSASARDILIRNGFSDVTNAGGLSDLEAASQK